MPRFFASPIFSANRNSTANSLLNLNPISNSTSKTISAPACLPPKPAATPCSNSAACSKRQKIIATSQCARFFESIWRDAVFGFRQLLKNPGFTSVAIFTLALGIGANSAIFSFVSGTLLRPLPYRDPDRLVQLWSSEPQRGWWKNIVSAGDFTDWKNRNRSFEDMAGYIDATSNFSAGQQAIVLPGLAVTSNFFSVLGVVPQVGQPFRPGDDLPGAPHVALISRSLWVQRFGSDPQIVGKSIRLNSENYTILGVAPSSSALQTEGGPLVQFWIPFTYDPASADHDMHAIYVIGRLRQGVSLAQAQQEMKLIASQLETQYPKFDLGWTVLAESLRDSLTGTSVPCCSFSWAQSLAYFSSRV